METKEYLELQNVMHDGAIISNVEVRNNRTYFEIDGKIFHTYANHVDHKDSPLFDHPFADFMAKRHNTAEGIEKERQSSEELDKEMDLWDKHKNSLYKQIFIRALDLFTKKGENAFIEYIDYHFDVMENGDNCKELIKLLEEK